MILLVLFVVVYFCFFVEKCKVIEIDIYVIWKIKELKVLKLFLNFFYLKKVLFLYI